MRKSIDKFNNLSYTLVRNLYCIQYSNRITVYLFLGEKRSMFYLKFTFKDNREKCFAFMKKFFENHILCGIARCCTRDSDFIILAKESPELWLKIWEKAWLLPENKLFVDNVCSWIWRIKRNNKWIDEDILSYCIHNKKGLYGDKTA